MSAYSSRKAMLATLFSLAAIENASAQSASTAGAAASAQAEIEQVIVTAQRREERLQDVPIAITVQTGETLANAGVTNIRDVNVAVPGLRVTGTGANVQPVIRGVQSQQTDPGNDPNVAVYLDGVYQPNQIANNFELADVQQIEVLKGPQGTLFGRNATGGAIRVFTLDPSFTPTGKVSLDYGRFNDFTAKAWVSGPLAGDVLAGSLSVFYQDSDGYHRDIVTNKDDVGGVESTAIRGKLLANPTELLSLLLTAAYMDRTDGDTTVYGTVDGNATARLFPGAIIGERPHEFTANRPAFLDSTVYMASLKVELETGAGTISSVSAYNDTDVLYTQDADFSNLPLLYYGLAESQEDWSQEIIFSSKQFGRFRAVAGAFYYHSDGRYDPLEVSGSFAGPVEIFVDSRQVTEAYAVFGEVNFNVTDRLTLTGGARYSDETKRAYGVFNFGPGPHPAAPSLGKKSWSSFTPRVSVQYRLFEDDNLYFTYSEGFKSGGFNIATADPVPFDQEELKSFELGLKTSPSRMLSANIAAFYYEYEDQQVQALVNNFNVTANAASSEIYGLEAELLLRPTSDFTLTAGVSLLKAEFDDYPNAVVLEPIVMTPGVACYCGNQPLVIDASGKKEPKSPAWTASLSANYVREFSMGEVALSASLYHSDDFYWDPNERVREPSYTTLAARASWRPADSGFRFSLWGRNLTNERYTKTSFILETGDGVVYAKPRTYGVGIEYSF